jgi:alanyl-tRNA synthetase
VTERLYYTQPYLAAFHAEVIGFAAAPDGRRGALLDRTAFYPTSGGQPHDTGILGGARVIDVLDRDDGTILHVVEGELPAGPVHGQIDWPRRFDHMQQHTGQHILSAACERGHGARTVSFHLGSESSTIDLATDLSPSRIAEAEAEANRIVWEDRPVGIRFVDAGEAAGLPLRKEPTRGGELRLIDVEDFDLSACGGTHVARTGAIGIIAIAGWERLRGGTRLEFLCGARALRGYRRLRDSVGDCTRLLSVLPEELPSGIARLQGEIRDLKRRSRDLQTSLASHEAAALASGADRHGSLSLVSAVLEGSDANALKVLASGIVSHSGFVAVLLGAETPRAVVIARSADVAIDAAAILRALIARSGGKGGGRPELAQGGGLSGTAEEILDAARAAIVERAPGT